MIKILKKLALIQEGIDNMSKEGFNNFNNYKYLMEAQVTTKVKELMDKHGVFFHPQNEIKEVKEYQGVKGDTQFLITVKINYTFYDVESGESLSGVAEGQGADKGDKGVYKAITGAIKYIYMKTFNIPTGDDAEKESPELKGRATTRTYTSQPKGPVELQWKKRIKDAVDTIDPLFTTKEEYEKFVLDKTGLQLLEENAQSIIAKLNSISK